MSMTHSSTSKTPKKGKSLVLSQLPMLASSCGVVGGVISPCGISTKLIVDYFKPFALY